MLNFLRMIFLDKDARLFRAFCKANPLWSKEVSSNRKVILVESPATRANLIGIRLFLGAATRIYTNNILLYRISSDSKLLRFKEFFRFHFSIERAMQIQNFKNIVWQNHSAEFYKLFFEAKCGVINPFEFELFEYKGVLVGDLIYDEYLRRSQHRTLRFDDKHFLRVFYELISYFEEYLDLFEIHEVEAVVVSNCVYHFAIPMRIACQREIPAYQVNSETIYRLSKSRIHAYTEFLDYSSDLETASEEFSKNLPAVQDRIKRRFSGEIGVDMPYSTKSAFSNSSPADIDSGVSDIKILVATHDFFDSPHSYGFNFYPDFYIWLETLGHISNKTDYEWYLKTHPDPIGDSDKVLKDLAERFTKFKVIPSETSHHKLKNQGINFVLTVFGTVGWEYPALGITTINASRNNPHVNFDFSITPKSRKEYEEILLNLRALKNFKANKSSIELFYYLHNYRKLHSFIYIDHQSYLKEVGGYGYSTTSYALSHYVLCRAQTKRSDEQILQAIGKFIESCDFRLEYKHFE